METNEYSLEEMIGQALAEMDKYNPGDDIRSKIIKEELEVLYRLHNEEKKIDNAREIEEMKIEAEHEIEMLRVENETRKLDQDCKYAEAELKIKQQELIASSASEGVMSALKIAEKVFDAYVLSELAYFEENRMFRSKALNEGLKKLGHKLF